MVDERSSGAESRGPRFISISNLTLNQEGGVS
jgi:hypothetical protein